MAAESRLVNTTLYWQLPFTVHPPHGHELTALPAAL
jgi:hypothetical protein